MKKGGLLVLLPLHLLSMASVNRYVPSVSVSPGTGYQLVYWDHPQCLRSSSLDQEWTSSCEHTDQRPERAGGSGLVLPLSRVIILAKGHFVIPRLSSDPRSAGCGLHADDEVL